MLLDHEDEDWTALDYARHHELTIKYDSGHVSYGDLPVPADNQDDWSPGDLSDVNIADKVSTLTRERLIVSKDAAMLLRAMHELQHAPSSAEGAEDRYKWMLSLKQELPLLKTDHELDLISFGKPALPVLGDLKIPSEILNEDNDEGFDWPAKYLAYPEQCDKQIKAEKLAVSRDVLLHLQEALADRFSAEDSKELVEQSLQYKTDSARQPLTPPLLPMSPPMTPYIPSSPANRLPLALDSSDPVRAELSALEKQIMGADSLQRSSSDDSMLLDWTHAPKLSPPLNEQTSAILKRRAEDLKVEGPLTPPFFSGSPMKKLKSVTFSEGLHQTIPDATWKNVLSDDGDESEPDFDELFKDLEPYATEARRKVETERLAGADTIARVDPPALEFTLPVAPWNEYSQTTTENYGIDRTELDAQMGFLRRLKREDIKDATSWHGGSSLERSLKWNIFMAQVSKIEVDEQLHGEDEAKSMLAGAASGEVAASSTQIWKPEGLRILDLDDEEDEIELAEVEEYRDVEILVRKRKLILEEESPSVPSKRAMVASQLHSVFPSVQVDKREYGLSSLEAPISSRCAVVGSHPESNQRPSASQPTSLQVPAEGRNVLMFGGFSATTALHKFMETRGKDIQALHQNTANAGRSAHGVQSQILPERSKSMSVKQTSITREQSSREQAAVNGMHPRISASRILLPALPRNLAPCSFIISSIFLQRRHLLRLLEQYQQAELIYRDYERPHLSIDEADILLSPSTGLILTTLQQTKQRPLPGQPDRSPLKERMSKLQKRYERLIVMISEALSPEMEEQGSSRPEDARDKESLTLLHNFAGTLEGEVLVKYVPGGDQALARFIVGEMAAYGLPYGSQDIGDIKPVAVETTWEVFLRHVGINPFAAQVIVASLKESFDVKLPGVSNSGIPHTVTVAGLSAFLLMGEEMRVKYFQTLMGGSRVLRNVSRVLDQEWVSAAHGYRLR
ncbi:hypothetical protein DE146DRAFT_615958 [Phaeosphaeria sp. MPI-PUGE-AT-0046c]|nr:hypothetical protein DE146DRAFT_615958 [Phaeosphaeria sp. MPI-PUGE-AT-0046c]